MQPHRTILPQPTPDLHESCRAGEFLLQKTSSRGRGHTSYRFVFFSAMGTAPLMELTVKLDEPVFVKLPTDQPGCELNTSPFFLTNIDQVGLVPACFRFSGSVMVKLA
jgi:hypothetical protein